MSFPRASAGGALWIFFAPSITGTPTPKTTRGQHVVGNCSRLTCSSGDLLVMRRRDKHLHNMVLDRVLLGGSVFSVLA
ncbi:unnamed protein product [Ectocarpus sp. 12 AP-2014]